MRFSSRISYRECMKYCVTILCFYKGTCIFGCFLFKYQIFFFNHSCFMGDSPANLCASALLKNLLL